MGHEHSGLDEEGLRDLGRKERKKRRKMLAQAALEEEKRKEEAVMNVPMHLIDPGLKQGII